MRRTLATAVFLLAAVAQAQSGDWRAPAMNIRIPGVGAKAQTSANVQERANQVEEQSDNSFKARWETEPAGKTLLKVLAPEGAHVEVWDGNQQVVNEDIPVSANVRPDTFYRFIVRWPSGAYFEKKLSAKTGMVLSLWVAGPNVAASPFPPPPARMCMPGGDFGSLKSAIKEESFDNGRLGVLRTSVSSNWFCAEQVGELIDLFSFPDNRVQVLRLLKDRIVDRNNNFKILGHFKFLGEKEQARSILSE